MQLTKLFNRTTRHRRERQANAFMLESLEPRVMLSATPMTAAVVTTDHLDYAPGETAVITTSNTNGDGLQFAAGELVRFQVTRTDGMADSPSGTANVGPAGNAPWYVVDGVGGFTAHQEFDANGQAVDRDANGVADWIAPDNDLTVNGSISTTWYVEEQYQHSSLSLTATGQESGAIATQAFTDAAVNTSATVIFGTGLRGITNTSTYGEGVNIVAFVTAATGTTAPLGSVEFFDGTTSLGIDFINQFDNLPGQPGEEGISSYHCPTISSFTAGTHAIRAVFTASDPGSFNGSTSGDTILTVSKADIKVVGYSHVYDGVAHGATALGVKGESLSGLAGTTHTNAGTYTDTWTFTDVTGNYNNASGSISDTILKANATLTATGYFVTYDGNAHQATGTVTGVKGESLSGLSVPTHTNVGIYIDTFTFTDVTGNYNNAIKYVKDYITKADATLTATAYAVTYDGNVHQAMGTATGVKGESLSGVTGTLRTHAGIYVDTVTYTDTTGNYKNAIKFVKDFIFKANATIAVPGYVVTYDGHTHHATGTVTGVKGESLSGGLNLFGTVHINAGTYFDTVTFTDVTGDYKNAIKGVIDTVLKANATLTVTGYFVTYDGNAHQATAIATGVGGIALSGVNLLGTNHTNAGTYTDTVTFTDVTGNYKNTSKFVKDYILKANATLTVSGFSGAFDGAAHGATGTAVGVKGESLNSFLNVGASFTTVPGGTANWTFSGSANYKDRSGSVAIVII